MADNLPTSHLPAQSRGLLMTALQGAGFSVAQERRLGTLTVTEIKAVLSSQRKSLGSDLTRPECDRVLKDLALVLPSGAKTEDQVDRMLDLYFGLLRDAGVTFPMLRDAAKRFVMAPNGGKAKFFPDPGQIAEVCAEDIRIRRRALAALDAAMAVAEGRAEPAGVDERPISADRMAELAEKLSVRPGDGGGVMPVADSDDRRPMNTARPNTDAKELRETISKRVGQAA